jgi:ketopantoate reductase
VSALCRKLGAAPADQVPFEKYAAAASGLAKPSSAARALANGAPNIERVDLVVQRIAAERGMHLPTVDTVVAAVNRRLEENRKAK